MEQSDYIQKIIDQLGKVLGKILADLAGFINSGKVSDGIEITNKALKREIGLDISELINTPKDNLLDFLVNENKLQTEHVESIANILLAIAENINEGDNTMNKKFIYGKCLALFEYVSQNDHIYSFDRHIKIENIKSGL